MRIGRRDFTAMVGSAATGSLLAQLPGCGYYAAESGSAYEPWHFPASPAAAEQVAAHAALLAASPHNTQPWFLRVTAARIDVFAALRRNLGLMDSQRRELHIGLGCAIENLVIAAQRHGRACDVRLLPDAGDPSLVASITLQPAAASADPLFDAIAKRHTNRGAYANEALPSQCLPELSRFAQQQGVELVLLHERGAKATFIEQTIAATRAIVADAPMNEAGHRWYRHSHAEIDRHRDGLTLDCAGVGSTFRVLGKVIGRPDAASAGEYWIEATATRHTQAAAFGLIVTPAQHTRRHQLQVGRAYQHMQLYAVSQGLSMQPLNQLPERQDREQTGGAPPHFGDVLSSLIGGPQRRVQLAFRIGRPLQAAFASPRRPLRWVLHA